MAVALPTVGSAAVGTGIKHNRYMDGIAACCPAIIHLSIMFSTKNLSLFSAHGQRKKAYP